MSNSLEPDGPGKSIVIVINVPCAEMQAWVEAIAMQSDQKVDWNMVGGRQVVVAWGDVRRARLCARNLRRELNADAKFRWVE